MIFLDTSFLYPLFNVEDEDHGRVREVFEAHRGRRLSDFLVTTPHVISETITTRQENRYGAAEVYAVVSDHAAPTAASRSRRRRPR